MKSLAFPRWARLQDADGRGADAAFSAGAGLALLDGSCAPGDGGPSRLSPARCASASPLKPPASCAHLARLREDEAALARRRASRARRRAGRSRRPSASAVSPVFDAPLRLDAADARRRQLNCWSCRRRRRPLEGLAVALREILAQRRVAAHGGARAPAVRRWSLLVTAAPVEAEIFALWLADLDAGANARLGTAGSARGDDDRASGAAPDGHRPRPGDADWADAVAGAYALAASEAYGLAGDLSRRAERLLAVEPKLRAKGAERVVELLLADDCVAPARAAKVARLSDRAAAGCSIG